MMYVNENSNKNAVQQNSRQEIFSVCYICGKQHTTKGELCHSCAGIISSALKPLIVSETAS